MTLIAKLREPVPAFLSRKRESIFFIFFVLLFAVVFIVVYHPIGFHKVSSTLPWWTDKVYTAVVVAAGFLMLVISRIILYKLLRREKMSLGGYFLWIPGEFLAFSLILTVVACLMSTREGVTVERLWFQILCDVISILSIPYLFYALILVLGERNRQIAHLNMLVTQHDEMAPVVDTINFYDRGGRLVFATRRSQVLYVESMDNYTKIYYLAEDKNVDSFVLHNSMKQVEQMYENYGLMRCHRCYIVNIENVKLLRRVKDGFVLEMAYGDSPIPVSKSYADQIVQKFAVSN